MYNPGRGYTCNYIVNIIIPVLYYAVLSILVVSVWAWLALRGSDHVCCPEAGHCWDSGPLTACGTLTTLQGLRVLCGRGYGDGYLQERRVHVQGLHCATEQHAGLSGTALQ